MVPHGPQVLDGVGPPGSPSFGVFDQRTAGRQTELPGQDHDAEIGWQEGVRVAEGAHGDGLDRPRTYAGQGLQVGPGPLPVGPGVEVDLTIGKRAGQTGERPAAGLGQGEGARVDLRDGRSCREQVGETACRVVDLLAERRREPTGVGTGGRGADLLAKDGPQGELVFVHGPGHPSARRLGDQRSEHLVLAELGVDGNRVGVEIEQPAAAGDGHRQVPQVGQGEPAQHVLRCGGEGHDSAAVWEPQGAPVGTVPPFLHPRHRCCGQVPEQVVGPQRCAERQPQGDRAGGGREAAPRPRPQFARGGGEDLAHRVVELPDAAEPRGEGHIGERQRGRLDEQSGGLRPLRPGQAERSGAELGVQQPLELPAAVAEPRGQPRHALAIDDTVGDEPDRTGDEIGAQIPLR